MRTENGRVKVDQKNLQMDFELKACKVFATANEVNKLSKPLQSRFRKLYLPKYSKEQFFQKDGNTDRFMVYRK